MASFRTMIPMILQYLVSEEKWASLQQENPYDPMSPAPMYNTAALTAVQPGSAFKPVTALAAMSCGLDEKKYL
ncbi:MAG: penicillin-binding transpeptidase domain-containing protein [Clostridia bacterium]